MSDRERQAARWAIKCYVNGWDMERAMADLERELGAAVPSEIPALGSGGAMSGSEKERLAAAELLTALTDVRAALDRLGQLKLYVRLLRGLVKLLPEVGELRARLDQAAGVEME